MPQTATRFDERRTAPEDPVIILAVLGTLTGLRRYRQLVAGDLAELLEQDQHMAVYGVPRDSLPGVQRRADALGLTVIRRKRRSF